MTRNLNRILIIAVCAVIGSLFTASGGNCGSTTLDNWLEGAHPGFSCTIGDKTFSHFTYVDTTFGSITTFIGADGVHVSPINDPLLGIGLKFDAGWQAGLNSSNDATIDFQVAVTGGGPLQIDDASLVQSGTSFDGTGVAKVSEDGCGPVHTITTAGKTDLMEHVFFTPTGSISVEKDIDVAGNAGSGTPLVGDASISTVRDTFSQIPEPRGISMLLGLGLAVGMAFRKRFQSVRG
jgi:hypothetical protein